MCSFLGHIVFGAIMLVALGLTIAAMFTPGWRDLTKAQNSNQNVRIPDSEGLFPFFCQLPDQGYATSGSSQTQGFDYCKDWWNRTTAKEKAVVASMVIAAILEIIAVVWTLVSICACCCKNYIAHPLPVLAFFAAVFLAIAVALYYTQNKDYIDSNSSGVKNYDDIRKLSDVGYSFYMTCGALAATILDIIVGIITLIFAKHCC